MNAATKTATTTATTPIPRAPSALQGTLAGMIELLETARNQLDMGDVQDPTDTAAALRAELGLLGAPGGNAGSLARRKRIERELAELEAKLAAITMRAGYDRSCAAASETLDTAEEAQGKAEFYLAAELIKAAHGHVAIATVAAQDDAELDNARSLEARAVAAAARIPADALSTPPVRVQASAPAKPRRSPTPQVPALDGMTPLGIAPQEAATLEAGIRKLADATWATHPNNPASAPAPAAPTAALDADDIGELVAHAGEAEADYAPFEGLKNGPAKKRAEAYAMAARLHALGASGAGAALQEPLVKLLKAAITALRIQTHGAKGTDAYEERDAAYVHANRWLRAYRKGRFYLIAAIPVPATTDAAHAEDRQPDDELPGSAVSA